MANINVGMPVEAAAVRMPALPNQALQPDDHLGRCAPSVGRR